MENLQKEIESLHKLERGVSAPVDRTEQESNKSSEDGDRTKRKQEKEAGAVTSCSSSRKLGVVSAHVAHRESVSDTENYNEALSNALDFYEDQDSSSSKKHDESPPKLRRSISRAYGER